MTSHYTCSGCHRQNCSKYAIYGKDCLDKKPKDLGKAKDKIKSLLAQKPLKLHEIKDKMKIYNDEVWVMALNNLVDDGILGEGEEGYFLK